MLSVDPRSAVPPYEQLRVQLLGQVRSGALEPGTKLPTVRRLAGDLGLAPNTVARCYRELERDRVIETRGRNGTFVANHDGTAQREAQRAAVEYAARIRQLGVAGDEALAMIAAALRP